MNRCFRGHYHDNRKDADECDEANSLTPEVGPEGERETPTVARSAASAVGCAKSGPTSTPVEPLLSEEEHAAAVAEARRRLEEGRRK